MPLSVVCIIDAGRPRAKLATVGPLKLGLWIYLLWAACPSKSRNEPGRGNLFPAVRVAVRNPEEIPKIGQNDWHIGLKELPMPRELGLFEKGKVRRITHAERAGFV